jgi:hypothetical protein
MEDPEVLVRPLVETDHGLVMDTMPKGIYYGSPFFRTTRKTSFFKQYYKLCKHMLASPEYLCRCLCLAEDPDVVLGYSIYKIAPKVLVYIYIKVPFRGLGFMHLLTNPDTEVVAHLTESGDAILKKYPKVVFDPFMI